MQRLERNGGAVIVLAADVERPLEDLADECLESESGFVARDYYCLSYRGCFSDRAILINRTEGIKIPYSCFAVRADLVDDIEFPTEHFSASLDLTCTLASRGIFLDVSRGSRVSLRGNLELLRNNDDWISTVYKQASRLRYLNSIRILADCKGSVDFSVRDRSSFRPLLVSGNLSWGTKAIFESYAASLAELEIDFSLFEYDMHCADFGREMTRKALLGEIHDVRKRYSHVMFIDGLSIPPWLLQSIDVPTILISTEDPHSLDTTHRLFFHYDYPFSNDRNVAEMFGVHYLPVAADHRCLEDIEVGDEYRSDVLFLGAIYPNRKGPLEEICRVCEKNGLKLLIRGVAHFDDSGSIIHRYFKEGIVPFNEAVRYYTGTRICVNWFRDVHCEKTSKNAIFRVDPYSLNPRCYDAMACGARLFTDYRPELEELTGKKNRDPKGDFSSFVENDVEVAAEVNEAKKVIRRKHSYIYRSLSLLAMIGEGFF